MRLEYSKRLLFVNKIFYPRLALYFERVAGYDESAGGGIRTHNPGEEAVLKTAVFAVSPHPQKTLTPPSKGGVFVPKDVLVAPCSSRVMSSRCCLPG